MKFAIDESKNIAYCPDDQEPIGQVFSSLSELTELADLEAWSREAIEEIWNGFAGVVPFDNLKPVKKFRNRPYGLEQIWKAIQRLAPKDDQSADAASQDAPMKTKTSKASKKVTAKKAARKPKPAKPDVEPRAGSNLAELIRLIRRKNGASIDEVMSATGWASRHTVRGRISNLGSKGMKIDSSKHPTRGRVYVAA